MKFVFCLLLFCSRILCFAQTETENQFKNRILNIIRNSRYTEEECVGTCNCFTKSLLFKQQDSLLRASTPKEILEYFNDPSYILKTYAAIPIMLKNDSLGYETVKKHITDSTIVLFYNSGFRTSFNSYLVNNYLITLKMKYYYGRCGTGSSWALASRISYQYGKPDKEIYLQKIKLLQDLLWEHQFELNKQGILQPILLPGNSKIYN